LTKKVWLQIDSVLEQLRADEVSINLSGKLYVWLSAEIEGFET